MEIRFRKIIIFKEDGLDEEGVRKALEERVTVLDRSDGTVGEGNEEEPIVAFYIDGDLAQMTKVKLDFHCWERDNVLWPMAF